MQKLLVGHVFWHACNKTWKTCLWQKLDKNWRRLEPQVKSNFLNYEIVMSIRTLTIFFSFLLFYFIFSDFTFFFSLLYWKDDEEGTWQGSHMTGHMMWHHRPRTWWKNLEGDVRAHGVCMVALSKKWGEHEVEACTWGQGYLLVARTMNLLYK